MRSKRLILAGILAALLAVLSGCDCPERALIEAVRECQAREGKPVFGEDGRGVGCDLSKEVPRAE